MKYILAFLAAATIAVPRAVVGQDVAVGQVGAQVGSTHSPIVSGLLEVLFPTAGFAYAGDWKRGFLPNSFRVAALIGFGATADGPTDDVCEDDNACSAWAVALVATTIWSIVGAVQTANDHNAAVRQVESRVLIGPSPAGGVSVGFRLALQPRPFKASHDDSRIEIRGVLMGNTYGWV